MNCTITGKLILAQPITSGTSKNGNLYKRVSFVIEEDAQYPKKVFLTMFGVEKVDTNPLHIGAQYKIDFVVDSKEYNGKWYSENNVINITCLSNVAPPNHTLPSDGDDLRW
jgi:hypothetical protein